MPIKIPTNLHNDLFITTLKIKEAVTEFIEKFLPKKDVLLFDLDTLHLEESAFIDSDMQSFEADLIYSCKTKNKKKVLIAFVFEHKSYMPDVPHVQPLVYMSTGWHRSMKQEDTKESSKSKRRVKKKPTKLPITIPVYLYHGKKEWQTKPFEHSFEIPDSYLKKYIPAFDYNVVDLSDYLDEELLQLKTGYLATALMMLKHHHDPKYLQINITKIMLPIERYKNDTTGWNFMRSIWIYYIKVSKFKSQEEFENITNKLPVIMKQEALSSWDVAKNQGREEGREEERENNHREFVIKLIKEFSNWSDSKIASFVGVPLKFVKQIRKEFDGGVGKGNGKSD